jgi:hypothetical protein
MKKQTALLAVLIGAAVIFAGVTLYNLATASPVETFTFAVPKAISNKLPACVPSGADCRWKLWRLQRQRSDSEVTTWDVYAKYRGRLYHAHAQRIAGHSTHWAWVISGHPYWLKMVRQYKTLNPTHVTHGPALMTKVPANATLCDVVAPLLFVNVTDDGGGVRAPNAVRHSCAPPSDGGVPGDCSVRQPDIGLVANCASAWWVPRSRHGGPEPRQQVEEDAGFLTDTTAASGAAQGVKQRVVPSQWEAPDARTTHQCVLPVGTPCP